MKINGRTVYVTSFTDDGAWVRDPYTGEEWFDRKEQEMNVNYAKVTAEAAFDVASFLERMIPDHCPKASVKEWEDVMNALYALANDTDAIVTDPDVLK